MILFRIVLISVLIIVFIYNILKLFLVLLRCYIKGDNFFAKILSPSISNNGFFLKKYDIEIKDSHGVCKQNTGLALYDMKLSKGDIVNVVEYNFIEDDKYVIVNYQVIKKIISQTVLLVLFVLFLFFAFFLHVNYISKKILLGRTTHI